MSSPLTESFPSNLNVDLLPPPDLPAGFKWSKNCAIYEFECNNHHLILTVPIANKQDITKRLAHYNKEKIQFLGKIALAAGVGEDAEELSFKAHENGEYNFNRHLKNGVVQPINENYFQGEKNLIETRQSNPIKRQNDLHKLESLKSLTMSIKTVFKDKSFKGLVEKPPSHPEELERLPKNDSLSSLQAPVVSKSTPINKQKQQIIVKKLGDAAKRILIHKIIENDESKKIINEFFDKNFPNLGSQKFLTDIIELLKNKNLWKSELEPQQKQKFISCFTLAINQQLRSE